MNKCSHCGRIGHKKPTCRWLKEEKKSVKLRNSRLIPVPEGFDLKRSENKSISQGEIDMACRVLLQCHREASEGKMSSPLERAMKMTGLGRTTLVNIKKQLKKGNVPEANSGRGIRPLSVPDRSLVTKINGTIEKLHERGLTTTVRKLQGNLDFYHGLQLSRRILARILHLMGYTYKAPTPNQRVLARETVAMEGERLKYLQRIKQLREEGWKILYLDESYVNERHNASKSWLKEGSKVYIPSGKGKRYILVGAGSSEGWVHTSVTAHKSHCEDYHSSMNSAHFEEIFKTICAKAASTIGGCAIIMDNAAYHKRPEDAASRITYWTKMPAAEVKDMWTRGEVPGQNDYEGPTLETKKAILAWIRKNPITSKSATQVIAEEHGHCIITLPPYHPELNAIEVAWGVAKNHVARKNEPAMSFAQLSTLVKEGLDQATGSTWNKLDTKVQREEQAQLTVLEAKAQDQQAYRQQHPDLVVHLGDSSDSESEDEHQDDILDLLAEGLTVGEEVEIWEQDQEYRKQQKAHQQEGRQQDDISTIGYSDGGGDEASASGLEE